MSEMRDNKSDDIKNWLNSINGDEYEHAESICSSVIDSCSSIIESSSDTESGEEFALGERNRSDSLKCALNNDLMRIPALTFNNVSITNSTNVHLGTIYKVTGNLNINVINNEEHHLDNVNVQTSSTQQTKPTIVRPACLIYPRIRWLAMDPLSECCTLPEPVEYVFQVNYSIK
ncbi:hypothetical protein DOY81_014985 [Sarcophaga bullata]|nr:hypothetical protein DOY81_014985 [Sarcophaga bullata]